MMVTRIEENLVAAVSFLNARGMHVPIVDGLPNVGWAVIDCNTLNQCGSVVLFPSVDGEDVEMIADGGWTAPSARNIFDAVFCRFDHPRLTARCPVASTKNIRILQRMGFRIEGIKRCSSGNVVMLGMLKSECRLLKRMH